MANKQESVSLEDAQRVIAAGQAKAVAIGSRSNVAVVDAGGNLVSHIRLDHVWVGSGGQDQTVAEAAADAF
jgi:uncharacterized protein GlcG (DUF336 family)